MLHPAPAATGILQHRLERRARHLTDTRVLGTSSSPLSPASPRRLLLQPAKQDIAAGYRLRYAQYLAATFNISLDAALAEAEHQLAPRRASDVPEAEAWRSSSS